MLFATYNIHFGLGTDHRFEGQTVRGFAFEHEDALLHLAAFPR